MSTSALTLYGMSRPVWGAWIEIVSGLMYTDSGTKSRPVWGAWIEIVSGLMYTDSGTKSRPVWGAWIEMRTSRVSGDGPGGRAPYGARGLKYNFSCLCAALPRRAPYGARGLKFLPIVAGVQIGPVAPRMGRVD